jgi:L-amino acid N-acyltransferase YncA
MSHHAAVLQTFEAEGRTISIQYMTPEDGPALLEFARSVPRHDLLFLRTDITTVEGVNEWVDGVLQGQMGVILAYDGNRLLGFSSVTRNPTSWARHIAELSVVVGQDARHHGFGLRLTEEAFRAAEDLAVMRMVARMTLDQSGAIELFRGLGFVPMAILPDQVIDQDGKRYDLLMMHQDIEHFAETLKLLDEA